MNGSSCRGRGDAGWLSVLCALSMGVMAQVSAASAELADPQYKVLHSFDFGDGANPARPPVLASDGKLHGVTMFGGPEGAGTAYRMTMGGQLTVVQSFDVYVVSSPMTLIQNSDGNYFGTSWESDYHGPGAVFRMRPNGRITEWVQWPTRSLLPLGGGDMVGATSGDAIFRITPGLESEVLHAFTGDEGASLNDLTLGPGGAIYGTASAGGRYDQGTAFKMTLDGTLTVLHDFGGDPATAIRPASPLVFGPDGNWYGATSRGGTHDLGTVYRMTPAGAVAVLHNFAGGRDDGSGPGSLLLGHDGNLYGTTFYGGWDDSGVVYSATLDGVISLLHVFGPVLLDGVNPNGLIEGAPGEFYGSTFVGGVDNGYGTVFRLRLRAASP